MREMGDRWGYGVVICDTQTEGILYMRDQSNRNDLLYCIERLNLMILHLPRADNVNVSQHQPRHGFTSALSLPID
jgi:hypothetical protein